MDKKRQHYIPQMYLRNFSNLSNKINQYDEELEKTVLQPIDSVAFKKYMYGKDGDLEYKYGNIESKAAETIRKIINDSEIDKETWNTFLFFISTLNVRTLKRQKEDADIINESNRLWNEEFKNLELKNIDQDYLNSLSESHYNTALNHYKRLNLLKPALLINETKKPFITSDSPVTIYNQEIEYSQYIRQYGIENQGIQIFLTINPKLCLFLYDPFVYSVKTQFDKIIINSEYQINEINKLIVLRSGRFIYYNNECDEKYIKLLIKMSKNRSLKDTNRPDLKEEENIIINGHLFHKEKTGKNVDVYKSKNMILQSKQPSLPRLKINISFSKINITFDGKFHDIEY